MHRKSPYWVRTDHRLILTDVSGPVHAIYGSTPGHMVGTVRSLPWEAAREYVATCQRVLDTGEPAATFIEPREGHPGLLFVWPVLGGTCVTFSELTQLPKIQDV